MFAIILLLTGTLLFFALISYSPRDLPSWVPWSYLSPPNRPAQNFIGPFGAIFASVFYLLIGAASYFLAAVLLGFGAAKLFYPRLRVIARLPWIVLFIVSGACLLQLQTRYFFDWKKLNIQGPGGSIGYFFGKKLLLTAMGDVGSMILLAGIYLSALILMTGLRPIHLVRESVVGIRNGINSFREWRLHREMRRADIKGQLAISERELAKQRRSIEKQLKKKGAPVPDRILISPEELASRPKPKVVDTTALPEEALMPPRKKPSLAELRPAKSKPSIAVAEARRFDAENYVLPSIDLLDEHDPEGRGGADPAELEHVQAVLIETLGQFGIAVAAGDITKGPTITRYEVYPAKGVRVDKIVSLERDLARATRAERINILAPIPGKDTVGIEIANTRKIKVTLRELMQSADWEEAKRRANFRWRSAKTFTETHHRRSGANATPAPCRDDRQRQERLHQRADRQHALSFHPGRTALHHDRSQGGRDADLQYAAASGLPGGDGSEKGAARAALGDRRNGAALQDFCARRRAQHHQFQRPATEEDAKGIG